MTENKNGTHEFKQVEIRLKVRETEPLYSPEPVNSAERAVNLLADFMKDMDRECVYIINLDSKLRPMAFNLAAIGGINYAPMDPANVFKSAILTNASHVIILHVHPSGDMTPSAADIDVTRHIALSGAVMGIPLQDHIIVAGGTGQFRSIKYDMPELFDDAIEIGEERADQAKMAIVAEDPKNQYEPAAGIIRQEPAAEHAAHTTHPTEKDSSVYNEVLQIIQRGQEIEKHTPEAWRLSHEVADIWSEHNGEKLNEQDFEVQKFIVITAEDIVKGNSDTIITSLSNMADRSDDSTFVKKAFKLLIAIEHYAERADPVLKEKVQTAEKAISTAKSFEDTLEENSRKAEVINNSHTSMPSRQERAKAV